MVNMLEKEGTQRPEAVVQARAAQILAEMLGVVCHRGHYEEGDQKVILHKHSISLFFFSHLYMTALIV